MATLTERAEAFLAANEKYPSRRESCEIIKGLMAEREYTYLLDKFAPEKWRCMNCGCLWRLNPPCGEPPLLGERTFSLWDGAQKSCVVCDNSPEFLNVIVPAEQSAEELLAQAIAALRREHYTVEKCAQERRRIAIAALSTAKGEV